MNGEVENSQLVKLPAGRSKDRLIVQDKDE